MDKIYNDVIAFLSKEPSTKVAFSSLVEGATKREKILTFVPLLHLTNARKLDLTQQQHFGEIWVSRPDKADTD
jgi:chromatin segregation and condensation protein Rec8/ScpA/Scc1 (kleisin family)